MKKLKKIFAIAGVIILVGMYAMTFITALFATESAHSMFLASIGATIIVPVFLYAYMPYFFQVLLQLFHDITK